MIIQSKLKESKMKRKPMKVPKARNPLVAAVMFRKAGSHDKPYKAKRRKEKVMLQTRS